MINTATIPLLSNDDDDVKYHSKPPKGSIFREAILPNIWYIFFLFVPSGLLLIRITISLAICSEWCQHGEISARVDILKSQWPWHFYILQAFSKMFAAHNPRAQQYYDSVAEDFTREASKFQLHPYFMHNNFKQNGSFHDCIHARLKHFAQELRLSNRDSFKIEKDKCTMYKFFQLNELPHCEILGTWYDLGSTINYMNSLKAKDLPVFIKSCHLTQGSMQGTQFVDSKTKAKKMKSWVMQKWNVRANDFDRVWKHEGNLLTDSLKPGFLAQRPFEQKGFIPKVQGRYSVGILEFRVEVFFGKAYLAIVDGIFIFLPNGEVEDYSTLASYVTGNPSDGRNKFAWIFSWNYMDCVWKLAEQTAKLMQIDALRVDIFLDRSHPQQCKLNEISLSSGMVYHGHEEYMAKAWSEPFLKGEVKTSRSTKPVYRLTEKDLKEKH